MTTLPNILHYLPSHIVQKHNGSSMLRLHSKHTTVMLHLQCLSCSDILLSCALWILTPSINCKPALLTVSPLQQAWKNVGQTAWLDELWFLHCDRATAQSAPSVFEFLAQNTVTFFIWSIPVTVYPQMHIDVFTHTTHSFATWQLVSTSSTGHHHAVYTIPCMFTETKYCKADVRRYIKNVCTVHKDITQLQQALGHFKKCVTV